jgi:SAM-dependent methyltransferase
MTRGVGDASFRAVAPYYDYLMRWIPYERWADYIESLFSSMRRRPTRMLDLCCGTGRFGLAMALRGYEVVGVDLSAPMVEVAAENARGARVTMPVAVADACALPFSGAFDAVVSVFDSLNNVTHEGGIEAAFRSAFEALTPRGLFILDVNTVTALEEELFTQTRTGDGELLHYDWVSRWDPASRLSTIDMTFTWRGVDPPLTFRETHLQRGWTDDELRAMLADAGLRVEHAYESYTFHHLTRSATRAHYIATRP